MRSRIPAFLLLALLAALVVPAAPARAGDAPDSAARAALQERIGHAQAARITGPQGSILLHNPAVRDDGLFMRKPWKPPRQALVVLDGAPASPPPVEFVPWSAIDEVRVARGEWLSGTVKGGLIGAGVGAGVVALLAVAVDHGSFARAVEASDVIILVGIPIVGVCTAVGAIVGSSYVSWPTVYPPPARRPGR